MKRRIYKKWLKNPTNKRLIWKFCKPFPKKIPVNKITPIIDWKDTAEKLEKFCNNLEQKMLKETFVPKESILNDLNESDFDFSFRRQGTSASNWFSPSKRR